MLQCHQRFLCLPGCIAACCKACSGTAAPSFPENQSIYTEFAFKMAVSQNKIRLPALIMSSEFEKNGVAAKVASSPLSELSSEPPKQSLRHRIRKIVWNSLDRLPEECRLIFKLDIFIL